MENILWKKKNILGSQGIAKLILKFALPSIIALLVNSLYNIVDQIFIGQKIGMIGNAATSVIFPIIVVSMAFASCIAEGGAAYLSLKLGAGQNRHAEKIVGNVIFMLIVSSITMTILSFIFFKPLLYFLGATDASYPYARSYTAILLIGLPFALIGMGINSIIRADGSPRYAMVSMITGALINIILDYIFIFKFDWEIEGAAWATVIGEVVSFLITIAYLPKFKNVQFRVKIIKFKNEVAKRIITYGVSNFVIQSAITLVIILYNNSLKKYGALSIYGSDIPLAAYGISAKMNQIFLSIAIGISIGLQPIVGFNYGAGNYKRVKQAFSYSVIIALSMGIILGSIVEIFPQIFVNMFGGVDNQLYKEFATYSLRAIFSSALFVAVQIVITNFFRAMGKPWLATISALSRFTIFLIPSIYFLPKFFGLKGVLFATPVADLLATILAIFMVYYQIKRINRLIKIHKQ